MLDKPSTCTLLAYLALICVLAFLSPGPLWAVERAAPADAQMMQQMDHQRRLDQQKAETGKVGASPIPLAEEGSSAFDYVILVGLAASAAGAFAVSRRKGRRQAPRRYPPHQPR